MTGIRLVRSNDWRIASHELEIRRDAGDIVEELPEGIGFGRSRIICLDQGLNIASTLAIRHPEM